MSRDLTGEEFGAIFAGFASSPTSTSVFRWEALQAYQVAHDEPSLVAFRDGTPRPERSVRTSPWLARIATSTAASKQWLRVRRVVEPWSEYVEWEMLAYVESQAAGERILVQPAAHAVAVDDFWLFDGAETDQCAIVMHYDQAGVPERFELLDDDARLRELFQLKDKLIEDTVPLNEYLADHARRAGARGAA